ncbi:hypothetical protein DICVIV_01883 [Dictyocaulus viviparus]|uniref:Nematode cuticle collagen N-terminal domain-containing protein n=1 Tax=Dictyocaulus viviparus TaxID=29172 RepID=A0A0D8Y6S8_DICVI|nr:hypothetical protein DICVIV_01883 [Dictyocaulus viviparus]
MEEKEIAGYRRLTFAGVTVAAMATTMSIVVVPLLFSHAQSIQSQLEVELKFCVMNTHNLYDEMRKVRFFYLFCKINRHFVMNRVDWVLMSMLNIVICFIKVLEAFSYGLLACYPTSSLRYNDFNNYCGDLFSFRISVIEQPS